MREIILASESAARRQLLANAGIKVRLVAHGVDEAAIAREVRKEGGLHLARRLALAKSLAAGVHQPEAFVIGADQTLECAGRVLGKPADRKAAAKQLRFLSGRTHLLHSAVAVTVNGRRRASTARTARMTMRELTTKEIEWYLDEVGEAAAASVGAYQVERLGIRLFSRIDGDYFTILGMPMIPLIGALRRLGAISP